jgi:hypothetical protein
MASKRKLSCKLISVEPAKKGRKVTIQFDDGATDGPWQQSWVIVSPDRPVSFEEFVLSVKPEIKRPIDFFKDVEQSVGKDFQLEI